MRVRPLLLTMSTGVAGLLALPAVASAATTTLGSTTPEAGSLFSPCVGSTGPDVNFQLQDSTTTPYTVPAGSWALTNWSTYTAGGGDTAGGGLTLVVLHPQSGGSYGVVAVDTETLPTPLPSGGVATFTPSQSILVGGGDLLGLYMPATPTQDCSWHGGTGAPSADVIDSLTPNGPPAVGQTLSPDTAEGPSPAGYQMNLAVTLTPAGVEDAALSTAAGPSNATAGFPALLSSTVSNNGPATQPITFTDKVPTGLAIESVSAGSGSCTRSGQSVVCTLDLAVGQSAPVDIIVTPHAAGSFANSVSVSLPTGVTDPNAANNSASANLAVAAASTVPADSTVPAAVQAVCLVPRIGGTPLGVARRVLGALDCRVGRVKHVHSRHAKGTVLRTLPGAGHYAAGRLIGLVVSSGPGKHHNRARGHERRSDHVGYRATVPRNDRAVMHMYAMHRV